MSRRPQVAPTSSPLPDRDVRRASASRKTNRSGTKAAMKSKQSGGRTKSSDRRTSYRDFGCIKSAPELPCFRRTYAGTPSDSEGDIASFGKPLTLGKTKSTGSVTQEVTSSGGNFFNRLFSRARSRSRENRRRRQEALETQCLLDCVSFTESPARSDVINIVSNRALDDEYPAADSRDATQGVELDVRVHRYRSLSSQWSMMDKELDNAASSVGTASTGTASTGTASVGTASVGGASVSSAAMDAAMGGRSSAGAAAKGAAAGVGRGATGASATGRTTGSQEQRSSTLPIMHRVRMCPTPPLAVFSSDEDISSVPQTPQHRVTANDTDDGHVDSKRPDDVDEQKDDYLIVTRTDSPRKEKDLTIRRKYGVGYRGDHDASDTSATVSLSVASLSKTTDKTTSGRVNAVQPKTISPELEERISRLFLSGSDHSAVIGGGGAAKPSVLRSHSLQEPSSQVYLTPGNIIVRRIPSPLSDNTSITFYSPTKALNRPKYTRRKHYTIHFGSLPSALAYSKDIPESKSANRRSIVLRQTSLHSYWSHGENETTPTDGDVDGLTPDGSNSCADLPDDDVAVQSGQVLLRQRRRRRSPSRLKSWKHSVEFPPPGGYILSRSSVSIPVLHFDSQAPKPVRQADPPPYQESRWMRLSQTSRDSQEDDDELSADPDQLPLLMTEVASTDSGIQQDETPTSCESFKVSL